MPDMNPPVVLRDATADDFDRIVELNEESVRFLSAFDRPRLALLHSQAAYHRVIGLDGQVAAFLLGFREGSAYDSVNYRWFAERYPRFLYIDRIVVGSAYQGQGLGPRFYEDLMIYARAQALPLLALEIDVDPPNPVSTRFHARLGFVELGSQIYGKDHKRVSLQGLFLKNPL